MYAIIRTGGKQYKVKAGDTLRVEKLEKELGSKFDLEEVLFIGGEKPQFGEPTVKGAKVSVVVTQQDRAKKILIMKKKRRKGYRKMQGHRQSFTELFIENITSPSGETSKSDKKAHVIDPVKSAEAKAKWTAEHRDQKSASGTEKAEKKAAKKAAVAAKKATKRAAPAKKKVAKSAKKKAGAKKSTKKTAKKKN